MPITEFLTRNANLYPDEVCLVEINPENKETHNLLKDALLTAEEWYISAEEAEETKEN